MSDPLPRPYRFYPADHYMWWPAFRIAQDEGPANVSPSEFADWFVEHRSADNVHEALAEYAGQQSIEKG